MSLSTSRQTVEIKPQPGPQEAFLSTPADIAIYGGAAGSGKTYGLILDPLRYLTRIKGFGGVIFRRNAIQVRNEGGLWDESEKLYPLVGSKPQETFLEWVFPPFNNKLKFAHLEYDNTVLNWQGSQICFIGFDELTHFSEKQFFYMISRNRSTCGIRPYIRATTNPDAESWVAEFISWWIDQDTGQPIQERSGVLRWFIRIENTIYWGDSPEELITRFESSIGRENIRPRSVTFIPAKLDDNPILERLDPGYRAALMSLPLVDRERLLAGNWKIRASSGNVFRAEWFKIVDTYPFDCQKVRFYDFASSEGEGDYTSGALIGVKNYTCYIIHIDRFQGSEKTIENHMDLNAQLDGKTVPIRWEEEKGSSGKNYSGHLIRHVLFGYDAKGIPVSGLKEVRAKPLSSYAESGNVCLVRGPWNRAFIDEAVLFPEGENDDQIDSSSGGFNFLAKGIVDTGIATKNPWAGKYATDGCMNPRKDRYK